MKAGKGEEKLDCEDAFACWRDFQKAVCLSVRDRRHTRQTIEHIDRLSFIHCLLQGRPKDKMEEGKGLTCLDRIDGQKVQIDRQIDWTSVDRRSTFCIFLLLLFSSRCCCCCCCQFFTYRRERNKSGETQSTQRGTVMRSFCFIPGYRGI